jgi:hypothetical protein
MNAKLKFWKAGVIAAAIGLVLARIVSGLYADRVVIQLAIFLTGVAVAMAGLGIILFGIRKKLGLSKLAFFPCNKDFLAS